MLNDNERFTLKCRVGPAMVRKTRGEHHGKKINGQLAVSRSPYAKSTSVVLTFTQDQESEKITYSVEEDDAFRLICQVMLTIGLDFEKVKQIVQIAVHSADLDDAQRFALVESFFIKPHLPPLSEQGLQR